METETRSPFSNKRKHDSIVSHSSGEDPHKQTEISGSPVPSFINNIRLGPAVGNSEHSWNSRQFIGQTPPQTVSPNSSYYQNYNHSPLYNNSPISQVQAASPVYRPRTPEQTEAHKYAQLTPPSNTQSPIPRRKMSIPRIREDIYNPNYLDDLKGMERTPKTPRLDRPVDRVHDTIPSQIAIGRISPFGNESQFIPMHVQTHDGSNLRTAQIMNAQRQERSGSPVLHYPHNEEGILGLSSMQVSSPLIHSPQPSPPLSSPFIAPPPYDITRRQSNGNLERRASFNYVKNMFPQNLGANGPQIGSTPNSSASSPMSSPIPNSPILGTFHNPDLNSSNPSDHHRQRRGGFSFLDSSRPFNVTLPLPSERRSSISMTTAPSHSTGRRPSIVQSNSDSSEHSYMRRGSFQQEPAQSPRRSVSYTATDIPETIKKEIHKKEFPEAIPPNIVVETFRKDSVDLKLLDEIANRKSSLATVLPGIDLLTKPPENSLM